MSAAKKQGAERFQNDADWVNPTPAGQLKDFSQPMDNEYFPVRVEASWDAYWNARGLFTPDAEAAAKAAPEDVFTMMMPPPNVTGTLHVGHALMASIEDALARYHRMNGRHVLWLPGVDHAGIATQSVVEKQLMKLEGKTRHDIGREAFLAKAWEWKEAKGSRIFEQLRLMGASADWSRERFTMDPGMSRAVTEAFVRMHEKGVVYRANRLINWSCELTTAISDIEVDHIDVPGPVMRKVPGHDEPVPFGIIESFAYRVHGMPGEEIVVSTTRLATMLGDVAVAVHPEDPRYKHLHGAKLVHPFDPTREVTVICDAELVDMDFGTGAVKVTPGHDPNDYACGVRHGLPMISILDKTGRINENGGEFCGQRRFVARSNVEAALKRMGLYRGKEPNPMRLGLCSRSGDVIEPMLCPQWYVDTSEMAGRAVRAVEEGELKIVPDASKETWFHWLREARPWCISRQLVWGHRIPAWKATVEGAGAGAEEWIVARNDEDARAQAAARWPGKEVRLEQDEDVLDTWFSSGLFPFATLGWPDKTPDMDAFFPGSLLETGSDILFFWVARMVMMSLALCDRLPFTTVYLHSMVRDKTGEKMSKSSGNVIDPLDMISGCTLEHLHETVRRGNLAGEAVDKAIAQQKKMFPSGLAQCGADALRFGLLSQTKNGRDSSVNLDPNVVAAYRQFCNKLWNATRFAFLKFPDDFSPPKDEDVRALRVNVSLIDRWILHSLHEAVRDTNAAFEAYDFAAATHAVHGFWYGQLCNVYVEAIKPYMQADMSVEANRARRDGSLAVLYTCIEYGLRLLHPLMPFVTEELFHRLQGLGAGAGAGAERRTIVTAAYPRPSDTAGWESADVRDGMELVQGLARAARSAMTGLGLNLGRQEDRRAVTFQFRDAERAEQARRYAADLCTLSSSLSVAVIGGDEADPAGCLPSPVDTNCTLFVPAAGLERSMAEQLRKMEKTLVAGESSLAQLVRQTSSANYASAPEAMKAKNVERMDALRAQVAEISGSMTKVLSLMPAEAVASYTEERAGRVDEAAAKVDAAAAALEKKLLEPKKPLNDKQKAKLVAQIEEKRAEAAGLREKAAAVRASAGGAGGAPALSFDAEEAKLDAKLVKACVKEGGKKGQDLAGMSDMGGVKFFHCAVEKPDGNLACLSLVLRGMNKEVDAGADDRKGGAGGIGKMVLSAGKDQVAVACHVPEALQEQLAADEWLDAVLKPIGGEVVGQSGGIIYAVAKGDQSKELFPLKMRDAAINSGFGVLKGKRLVVDDESEDDVNYAELAGVEW